MAKRNMAVYTKLCPNTVYVVCDDVENAAKAVEHLEGVTDCWVPSSKKEFFAHVDPRYNLIDIERDIHALLEFTPSIPSNSECEFCHQTEGLKVFPMHYRMYDSDKTKQTGWVFCCPDCKEQGMLNDDDIYMEND